MRARLLVALPVATALTCADPPLSKAVFCDPSAPLQDRVDDLFLRMNTTLRMAQLAMRAPGDPDLAMPDYNFGGEALHGVWSTCINSTAPGGRPLCPTQFPSVIALGSTFNPAMWHSVGAASGVEARGLYQADGGARSLEGPIGLSFYAPNVNILRDPRWGRGEEVPGEDPFMNAMYGRQFVS
eukprot:gene7891-7313_t